MSTWPTLPNWNDPALLNGGEKYNAADGVTASDFNKIVENLLYMEKYGIGGGSCAGKHVIEVDELPTEGIDVNAVYLCKGIYYTYSSYFYDTLVCESAVVISLRELYEEQGLAVYCHILPTMTTEGLIESDFFNGFHLYYIEDPQYENIYIYDGTTLMPLSIAFSYEDTVYTYGGTVSKTEEATKNMYYYAFFKNEWKAYRHVSGTIDIVENGTGIDVAGFEKANVNVPIPEGYVKPEGEVNITEPGTYDVDVAGKKTAKVNIPKSDGLNINGIIKQYKVNAGASVNAGDFVEFVNKFGSGTVTNTTINGLRASKLDDSRVLIGYSYPSATAGKYDIAVVVVSVANGEISIGSPYVAITKSYTSLFSFVALTDNKAIVGYTGTYQRQAQAMHLSIDGLTVSGVKSVTMSDYSGGTTYIRGAAKLTDSKAFITYEYILSSGTHKLWGGVITATEAETTNALREFFSTANVSVAHPVALTGDKVVLFYLSGDSSPWELKAVLLNPINDASILSQYTLGYSIYGMVFAAVALSESKVMAVWADSSSQEGYACVIDVNGTSIAPSKVRVFCSNTIGAISAVTLNEHKVLVSYLGTSDRNGKAVVLTVDGDTITEGEPATYEDGGNFSSSSPVVLDENNVFIAYKTSIGEFTQIAVEGTALAEDGQIGTLVQPATSNKVPTGVAKTAGTEGETVDVFCVQ